MLLSIATRPWYHERTGRPSDSLGDESRHAEEPLRYPRAPLRLLLLGLDCVPPSIAFDRWADLLPNLGSLRREGLWGPLRSCFPPITVPAWTCMVSGRDPGELGLYGFRNRSDGYDLRVATSADVRVKRLWDRLGEAGHRVASLFVPLTSPPTPLRGHMVSCFLTPGPTSPSTFPPQFQSELEARFGPYRMDVEGFRGGDLRRICEELHGMLGQHFAMARHTWRTHRPDFLMMVEMGPDRLHHALWHHMDPAHPDYREGNRWEAEAQRYYAALDAEVGRFLDEVGDDTTVIVASDHGARACLGGVAVNEWLAQRGLLRLRHRPAAPTPLREVVDWSRTAAWAEGGYYARVFLNIRGREPRGVVAPEQAPALLEDLAAGLVAMGPEGTRVFRPEELYGEVRGKPPELLAFFGDLAYRSVGTVGHGGVRVGAEDGCNHDWDGVFVMRGPGIRSGQVSAAIHDVGRTALGLFEVPADRRWRGRDWSARPPQPK